MEKVEPTRTRSDAHREWVARYKAENRVKPCRVHGCRELRDGLGRYCTKHTDRATRTGSPILRPIDLLLGVNPLSKELAQRLKAGDLPRLEKTLLGKVQTRTIPRDQKYIYLNTHLETGITQAEKARAIIATAARKAGPERVLAFALLWAVAEELDKDYHQNPIERRWYFRTHLGNDLATLADLGKQWTETKTTYVRDNFHWTGQEPVARPVKTERIRVKDKQTVQGAVKRKAGAMLLEAVQSELGLTANWLNDDWIKPYTEAIKARLAKATKREREYQD